MSPGHASKVLMRRMEWVAARLDAGIQSASSRGHYTDELYALQEAIRALGGVVPPEAITRAREVSRRRVAEQAQACTCRRCPVHRTQET